MTSKAKLGLIRLFCEHTSSLLVAYEESKVKIRMFGTNHFQNSCSIIDSPSSVENTEVELVGSYFIVPKRKQRLQTKIIPFTSHEC